MFLVRLGWRLKHNLTDVKGHYNDDVFLTGDRSNSFRVQVNYSDPDGNHIHMDFPLSDKPISSTIAQAQGSDTKLDC